MSAGGDRLDRAVNAIDSINAEDPRHIDGPDGRAPKEIVHAQAMTRWVRRLDPTASDQQLVAARAHHLRRWTRPRSDYPLGRAGYLRWRRDARRAHARDVAELLTEVGFSDDEISYVSALVGKTADADDAAAQTHQDALGLVFLELQGEATAAGLGEDRSEVVLGRTLAKMSPAARAEARHPDVSGPLAAAVGRLCDDLEGR